MKLIAFALLELNDLSVIYTDIGRSILCSSILKKKKRRNRKQPLETFMETSLANHSLFVSYFSSFHEMYFQ